MLGPNQAESIKIFELFGIYLFVLGLSYLPIIDLNTFGNHLKLAHSIIWDNLTAIVLIILGILMFFGRWIRLFSLVKRHQWYNILSLCLSLIGIILFLFKPQISFGGANLIRFLIPIFFLGSYWMRVNATAIYLDRIPITNATENYDNYIYNQDDDRLNRSKIALRIYELIDKTSVNSTLRLGIYGKWGEGKTSIMHLIRGCCDNKRFAFIWFNPWLYRNKEELWNGFRVAVEEGVLRFRGGIVFPSFLRQVGLILLNSIKRSRTPKQYLGVLIDELIKSSGTPQQEDLKKKINEYLKLSLPEGSKIIIFVDDLDRVHEGKVLLDVLMVLKELVNLERLIFLIAMDVDTVSKVIEKEFHGESGKVFLEKIIDYAFYLPTPTEEEMEKLVLSELEQVGDSVKANVINNIKDVLPKNPRQFKRFLRYLGILKPTLSRFADDELNWEFLYIAQMLNLEFPQVIRNIINKSDCRERFSYSSLITASWISNKDEGKPSWEEETLSLLIEGLPELTQNEKARMMQLITALKKHNDWVERDILFHFRIVEYPSLMSIKEFLIEFNNFKPGLESFKRFSLENQKEYILKLLRLRMKSHDNMVESTTVEDLRICGQAVCAMGEQFKEIIDNINIVDIYGKQFFIGVYTELFNQISRGSRFKTGFYTNVREQDKILLTKASQQAKVIKEVYWEVIQNYDIRDFDIDTDLKELISKLKLDFEKCLADELIEKFEIQDGIHSLWGKDESWAEKYVLLQKSPFHIPENYERLEILAAKAKEDRTIRVNFVEFFRLLFYYATKGGGYVGREEMMDLIKDKDLIRIIWKGVTAGRLNRRVVGSIVPYLELIERVHGSLDKVIEFPSWWYEEEYEEITKNFAEKKAKE